MATALLAAFAQQARWCHQGGAPFSARVLEAATRWLEQDEASHALISAVAEDPVAGAVPLRFLAGLHHLALLGQRPWAALWPPADNEAGDDTLESAVANAWHFRHAHMAAALAHPPQTNEVQRSAALMPGLLHVAARTGLPLALLEIGASAGLNLWPDHYCLQGDGWQRGAADSSLVLRPQWQGPPPPEADLAIDYRAGCDAAPIDLATPGEDLRLASYIWADQPERLQRLQAAVQIAQAQMAGGGVTLQAARAAQWMRQQLTLRLPGQAVVLMHSVVWQYIPAAEQAAITALMNAAGAASTPDMPLAWLRFEPPQPELKMELRCRIWPGGEDRLLARVHPHGATIEWLGDTQAA